MNDNFVVHAVKSECNWGGKELQISASGDVVRFRINFGDHLGKPSRWIKTHSTPGGEVYFLIDGRREYLRDYMRV